MNIFNNNIFKYCLVIVFIILYFKFGIIGLPKPNIQIIMDSEIQENTITEPTYKLFNDLSPDSTVYGIVSNLKTLKSIQFIKIYNKTCDPNTYFQDCRLIGGDKNFAGIKTDEVNIARYLSRIYRNDIKQDFQTIAGKYKIPSNDMIIYAEPVIINNVEFKLIANLKCNGYLFYLSPLYSIQYNRIFYPYVIKNIELIPINNEANLSLLNKNKKDLIALYDQKYKFTFKDSDVGIYSNDLISIRAFDEKDFTINYSNFLFLEQIKITIMPIKYSYNVVGCVKHNINFIK